MDVFLIMAFHIGKVFAVGALPTEIVQVGLAIKKKPTCHMFVKVWANFLGCLQDSWPW